MKYETSEGASAYFAEAPFYSYSVSEWIDAGMECWSNDGNPDGFIRSLAQPRLLNYRPISCFSKLFCLSLHLY